MQKIVSMEVGGRTFSLETGRIAKQASGAVLVRYGDSVILVTAVGDPRRTPTRDFLPLYVEYREKAYAAGKIPGGFFKREGRPHEKETLVLATHRPPAAAAVPGRLPPETQIIATVLSFDQENEHRHSRHHRRLGGAGACPTFRSAPSSPASASAASKDASSSTRRVASSTRATWTSTVAGTDENLVMVEGGCDEVTEADLVGAGVRARRDPVAERPAARLVQEFGARDKMPFGRQEAGRPGSRGRRVRDLGAADRCATSTSCACKAERYGAMDKLNDATVETTLAARVPGRREAHQGGGARPRERDHAQARFSTRASRADGRRPDEIRPITIEVGVLPRTHGTRVVHPRRDPGAWRSSTLGTSKDEQRIDSLEGEWTKRYMLHYNFPPFSVNEVGIRCAAPAGAKSVTGRWPSARSSR